VGLQLRLPPSGKVARRSILRLGSGPRAVELTINSDGVMMPGGGPSAPPLGTWEYLAKRVIYVVDCEAGRLVTYVDGAKVRGG
jgi:hypothetical protein